jgi:hypothetical protein
VTRLLAARPRRLAAALLVFVLVFALVTLLAWRAETRDAAPWTPEDLMTRLFALPALAAVAFLAFASAWHASPAAAAAMPVAMPTEAAPAAPFRAQVVGIQWMNPLEWMDYATEWNLLWTLGLAGPNEDDKQVAMKPEKYSKVRPVRAVVSSWNGRATFARFFAGYIREIFRPIGRRYAMNGKYFYTVQPQDPKRWRELAGIHVEFALPATPQLPPDEAATIVREALDTEFEFYNRNLSTRNTPADVRITAGGANAGFTSLGAALDYLEAHPDETVWAMNWDAPDFPLDEQMTENCVLLVLAGPNFDTAREPLAWVGRPAVRAAEDFEVRPGEPRAVQAWRAAFAAAAMNAARPLAEVGYVIHDAGRGSDAAGARVALLGHALAEPLPELDLMKQGFNTPALLGELRAGNALTNVALAVAYAHHQGVPVLVAGTTEPARATALVVTPPARARVFEPDKTWFRARGEGNAYLPWWGLRRDADWNTYMQGFSE